jgi:hypothetical protein
MRRVTHVLAVAWCLCVVIAARTQTAQTPNASQAAATPGELFIEPPTLINLGFEWFNVTDDFSGRAPDLGALETGKPAIHYGPRR